MGLDMFLYKVTSLEDTSGNIDLQTLQGKKLELPLFDLVSIKELVGYWRKTNAIHGWFVDHIQDGQDDGLTHKVNLEELKELLTTVERVLAKPELADDLLPTQDGFFFGSPEYDEYYIKDLEYTRDTIKKIIDNHPDYVSVWYEYEAWW